MHPNPIGLRVTTMARLDPALAKSRCSSTASVKPASSGQAMPATSHRRSVNRTVDDATPTRRAISRVDIPAFFNLTQSRTWRIDVVHAMEMLTALKTNYYAAWHGEKQTNAT
jgi:hypothetical protein